MGAWGSGIFADDTAADIHLMYRELLEDRVPDDEAARRVIAAYDLPGNDEIHLLWLAMAAAQHRLGRLDDEVRRRALAVIESGDGLELWAEAGPKALAGRKAVLARLRTQLTGPQPARKAVRRSWRHVTDLEPGAVLKLEAENGATALLRVLRIETDRTGAHPAVERLDWSARTVPGPEELDALPPRWRTLGMKLRRKDPDWVDVGLSVADTLAPRPDDANAYVSGVSTWEGVAGSLRRELAAEAG